MNLTNLKRDLEARKNKVGLVGTRLDVSEVEGASLSAHITTDWRTICMQFGRNLDIVPDEETKSFVKKKSIDNADFKVGCDVLDHEMGHREKPVRSKLGCPYTVEMHEIIKEGVFRGLKEKGKTGLEDYVTNAFEDVLNNINCRRSTDFSGQTLFWNNQGLIVSRNGKYAPFYEAFVRINLLLGGSIPDYNLLKRFFVNDSKVKSAVNGFLEDLAKELSLDHVVRLHEKNSAFETLFTADLESRERLWASLAYSFALNTADLLEELPEEQMFGGSENNFDKEASLPKTKQDMAFKRYKAGKGAVLHRDFHDQLYDLYKRISKEIPVETSSYAESQGLPLVHYGKRFVEEGEQKFRFKGVGFKDDGSFGIKTSRHSLQFPVSYKVHPRKFPKFKLALVDRSGSMELSPNNDKNVGSTVFIPWGDNSKYHYALKGYFGVENYFERQGISEYVQSCVLGFSGEYAVKGDSRTVGTSLLSKPSGGTSLDIDGLEKELSSNALVLSISDGEVGGLSDDVKERFKQKIMQEGVDYAHVQIGNETDFSRFLKDINVPVIPVRGDNDLARTMITFVSGHYKTVKGDQK